jgi:hypothetical protein
MAIKARSQTEAKAMNPHAANPIEPPAPPAVDISSEADRDHLANEFAAYRAKAEAIAADRDRLRACVRSARGIIQEYAREHPKHSWTWQGSYQSDPMGAHGWLEAEAAEIGTARDGGDPKVEGKRT